MISGAIDYPAALGCKRGVDPYYRDHVIAGPHSFLVAARDQGRFTTAVREKLLVEIAERDGTRRRSARPS